MKKLLLIPALLLSVTGSFQACNTFKKSSKEIVIDAANQVGLTSNLEVIQDNYSLKGPIKLKFTVTNSTTQEFRFTSYQTPFEPFLGNYLTINDEKGTLIDYSGPMARRVMPPPTETYHFLAPNKSESVEFDISKVYKFSTPGKYTIQFNGDGMNGIQSSNVLIFNIR